MSVSIRKRDLADLWESNAPIDVQRGDIWQLGKHRLMVGDSTSQEDVSKLFNGSQFSLCFTSPPYGSMRDYTDASTHTNWHDMMCQSFQQMIAFGEPDCHILINLGLNHRERKVDLYWLPWLLECERMGWPLFGWYVWDKLTGLPGEWGGRLAPAHEWLFHFNQKLNYPNKWIPTLEKSQKDKRKTKTALRDPDGKVPDVNAPDKFGQLYRIPDSVLRIGRESARGIHTDRHPAVFPVALPEFIYRSWSSPGDIVYEPFCGSGTSLIAGENLHRTVYAMEIAPQYVELAIQRWQIRTCQHAVLVHRSVSQMEVAS